MTTRPLSKLTRWDRNYRCGNIEAIISSIVRFGFRGALRVRGDGTVIAGNQSLIALETMRATGAKPPTCIKVDAEGEWLVPVIVIEDLNQLESQALAIADNRTHDLGQDDPLRLSKLLQELQLDDDLFVATGYSGADLEELLALVDQERIADNVPEPVDVDSPDFGEVRPTVGDLWQLGNHVLAVGDMSDPKVVARVLENIGPGRQSLCLTDPPYAVDYQNIRRRPDEPTRRERGDVFEDDPRKAEDVLRPLFSGIPSEVIVMTFPLAKHFRTLAKESEPWGMLYELVWVKQHFCFNIHRRYQNQHEMIYVFRRLRAKGVFNTKGNSSTVFQIDRTVDNPDHPTPKPVELWTQLMMNHSSAGDIVIDPFCGSGTTIVCAEELGRKCAAIEVQPRFAEVILRRWEEQTGHEARLLPNKG